MSHQPEQSLFRPVMRVPDFIKRKQQHIPITMVTSYDAWSAAIIEEAGLDCILVGDSSAMVMHGYSSTIPADSDMIRVHTAAVRRGAPSAFVVADMPFLTGRGSLDAAVEDVRHLMQAGANAVKIEGAGRAISTIRHLTEAGVPVMGHLGLTPQSVHALGGYRVQGRSDTQKQQIRSSALALQNAGCFALVLECVPEAAGTELAEALDIPVIGIGAGSQVDGQVLVLHDLLGLSPGKAPKFVRQYMNGAELIRTALQQYQKDVRNRDFPGKNEVYT